MRYGISRFPTQLHALLAILSLCACDRGATPTSIPIVTDSAGIRILEIALRPAAPPDVTLSPEPDFILEGYNAVPFHFFRIANALVLPDGGLAVANAGNHEILLFDDAGTFTGRLGRSGAGPGEFAALQWLGLIPPDLLAAGDARLPRVAIFDPAGALARSVSIATNSQGAAANRRFAPQSIGSFGDGSIALASWAPSHPSPDLPDVRSRYRASCRTPA